MKKNSNMLLGLIFLVVFCLGFAGLAESRIAPPAPSLIFTSEQSFNLLKKDLNPNTIKLLANFTTQKNGTYCGVASAVMVLNSLPIPAPIDSDHSSFHYFTQDNIFNDKVLEIIKPEQVAKEGMQLSTLGQLLKSFALNVEVMPADQRTEEQFRKELIHALANQDFIIVNFLRKTLHQEGGGHFSPIAAYDPASDRFLVLDVARYKYDSYWVKTADLWQAIHTKDGAQYRGFLLINSSPANKKQTTNS